VLRLISKNSEVLWDCALRNVEELRDLLLVANAAGSVLFANMTLLYNPPLSSSAVGYHLIEQWGVTVGCKLLSE